MFRTVPLSIIWNFFTVHTAMVMSYKFADSLRAGSGRILLASCQQTCTKYTIAVCTVKKLLMMDRGTVRNMLSLYSKNKLEKLVHLIGFIIRIYHDVRSPKRQNVSLYIILFQTWSLELEWEVFFFFTSTSLVPCQ